MALNLREVFAPAAVAANWTEAASNQIPYLGATLFPARKKAGLDLSWLKGSRGLAISPMPTDFDAKATFGDRIGFAPTLDEALDLVFGGDSGASAGDAEVTDSDAPSGTADAETGEGTVEGELTIKGTTKSVDFKVDEAGVAEDPFGNTRLGFEAKTSINRLDFGIDFNAPLTTGGVLVSEEIKIELEVSAIKQ